MVGHERDAPRSCQVTVRLDDPAAGAVRMARCSGRGVAGEERRHHNDSHGDVGKSVKLYASHGKRSEVVFMSPTILRIGKTVVLDYMHADMANLIRGLDLVECGPVIGEPRGLSSPFASCQRISKIM